MLWQVCLPCAGFAAGLLGDSPRIDRSSSGSLLTPDGPATGPTGLIPLARLCAFSTCIITAWFPPISAACGETAVACKTGAGAGARAGAGAAAGSEAGASAGVFLAVACVGGCGSRLTTPVMTTSSSSCVAGLCEQDNTARHARGHGRERGLMSARYSVTERPRPSLAACAAVAACYRRVRLTLLLA